MEDVSNPVVSSKSSESGLHVLLHPLVLLNISDHITRHSVRQQTEPIVGALLGQQQGRNISLEHVFECKLVNKEGDVVLDQSWFDTRLKQFKDVHKDPALELVGWFTTTPPSGPTPAQLPIHRQILENYNETAVLLAFHASGLENMSTAVGKLPLTILESTYEGDNAEDADKAMQIDGQQQTLQLKFRELPYSIETGEAEMISVDFVASGGGNASAITGQTETQKPAAKTLGKQKGKQRAEQGIEDDSAADISLPREDEDLIANLNTRLSAVKILQSRLHLIQEYLSQASNPDPSSDKPVPQLSHTLLRSIYSLVAQLSLINPQTTNNFSTESLAQANDVALVSLLGAVGENVQQMRELGRKFAVTYNAKLTNRDTRAMRRAQMGEQSFSGSREMA